MNFIFILLIFVLGMLIGNLIGSYRISSILIEYIADHRNICKDKARDFFFSILEQYK